MAWACSLDVETGNAYRILIGNPTGIWSLVGRPRRQEYSIMMNLTENIVLWKLDGTGRSDHVQVGFGISGAEPLGYMS
jgi:hypothetical protein